MRKPLRNTLADTPPLTPVPTVNAMLAASSKSLSPQVHKLITINNDNLQRLEDKVARLKAQLAAERRRHVRLENALSKYFAIVEQEIREKTNRVDILRKALLPELKVGPKQ